MTMNTINLRFMTLRSDSELKARLLIRVIIKLSLACHALLSVDQSVDDIAGQG